MPGEDDANTGTTDSGGASVLFGAGGGLSAANDLCLPGAESATNGTTSGHEKGTALAALNWTAADMRPFLAISAIGHSPGVSFDTGGIAVRRGASAPLSQPVAFVERSDYPGEPAPMNDELGYVLAAGDFNNDGFDDLLTSSLHTLFCPTSLCANFKGNVFVVYGAASATEFVREKNHAGLARCSGCRRGPRPVRRSAGDRRLQRRRTRRPRSRCAAGGHRHHPERRLRHHP